VENRVPRPRYFHRHRVRSIHRRPPLIASFAGNCPHPGLAPYARWLTAGRCPDLPTLNGLARERGLALPDGRPLVFVAPPSRLRALDYERAIAGRGVIATRTGNLHDAFNALAWIRFPRTKAALNAVHVRAAGAATGNARNRARNAATLLDESGLLLCCIDAGLVALLRARAWRELFWERRDAVVRSMRPLILGHGLAEKLLSPYRALTASVLIIEAAPALAVAASGAYEVGSAAGMDAVETEVVDAEAAALIAASGFGPDRLTPLPVAALPGWDTEGKGEDLFDDLSVFRPPVLR
jgi:hypothetical protein